MPGGIFQRFYDSGWHHPGMSWAVGAAVMCLLALKIARGGKQRSTLALLFAFQLAIAIDAWFTGTLCPINNKTDLYTGVAIGFVVLGDLRYFILVERYGRGRTIAGTALAAIALSLVIPVVSLVSRLYAAGNMRIIFLTYELMFAALAAVFLLRVVPRLEAAPAHKRWLRLLTLFELVQYIGWASADIVILMGHDVGFALRLVPNFMYYGAFVPFAYFTQPKAA